MPRPGPITSQLVKQAIPAGRPKAPKVVLVTGQRTFYTDTSHRQPDVKETCPLCIEELDDTDKDFYPCPCGYQVCLFCYGRLHDLCKNMCPGCRREYGAPVEATLIRQLSEERSLESENSALSLSTSGGGGTGGILTSHTQTSISTTRSSIAASAAASAALGARTAAVTQPKRELGGSGTLRQQRHEDIAGSLPTGATWAAAAPTRNLDPTESTSVDESAWPSLGAAVAATPATQPPPPSTPRHLHSTQVMQSESNSGRYLGHERSDSNSSASADAPSHYSTSSQDLNQDQTADNHFPSHLQDAFATAQVSTMVYGTRHTVNVPLSGLAETQVNIIPEAPAMKANLQQAVAAGTTSSKEAAARLVALLRNKKDVQQASAGAVKPTVTARSPPPGFSGQAAAIAPPPGFTIPAVQMQQHQVSTLSASSACPPFLTHQDPSVPPPPVGRHQPIQPPTLLQSSSLYPQQNNSLLSAASCSHLTSLTTPQSPSHDSGFSASTSDFFGSGANSMRSYSMWSGLPGIDLGAPLWQGQSLFGELRAASSSTLMRSGMGTSRSDVTQSQLQPSSLGVGGKPPPPGFGPTPLAGDGGRLVGGVSRPYMPFGNTLGSSAVGMVGSIAVAQGYNPLQAQLQVAEASRAPPPGMVAYRPQLGTGF
ncbi:hypothetical protein CEUSTIGMA_g6208.t1 [Chlamydomonas eustigma]|uniref:RING-type domain-containing protein n=1 Tax=Chlamydomonas eustigma TaxID=1157962 RepID=A0A250X6R4_9CHLO|nr:hypothetical protein CEUSTIGMA_g6208.t1 [Chlamydomonas eustigma]|eukprot:GAX78771.1 hypothetical protein CEUSTIGMA_g6208.t1 [Chlamydomonas eustigma]